MKNIRHISICILLIFIAGFKAAGQEQKPNIILILTDDMGWMDSEPYGNTYYETPHLTRLANEGMLFTDAYAASPLCSPTRASIMSGQRSEERRVGKECVSTCRSRGSRDN